MEAMAILIIHIARLIFTLQDIIQYYRLDIYVCDLTPLNIYLSFYKQQSIDRAVCLAWASMKSNIPWRRHYTYEIHIRNAVVNQSRDRILLTLPNNDCRLVSSIGIHYRPR